jgi:hypothetical protein
MKSVSKRLSNTQPPLGGFISDNYHVVIIVLLCGDKMQEYLNKASKESGVDIFLVKRMCSAAHMTSRHVRFYFA